MLRLDCHQGWLTLTRGDCIPKNNRKPSQALIAGSYRDGLFLGNQIARNSNDVMVGYAPFLSCR